VGAPLGIMARRGGLGTGVIYSLAFFVLYWVAMIRGEALADRLEVSPVTAMWSPNVIVGIGGLWLLWRVARERYTPGQTVWKRLAVWIGGVFRARRASRAQKNSAMPHNPVETADHAGPGGTP
jgi:lipopolysaccharide export system permease protein